MANRYSSAVLFAMEKNLTILSARVTFDASGACALVPNSSKGFCAMNPESVTFTGATTNSSSTIGTVSSFAGLFTGMTVTGSTGSLQAATTLGSLSVAGGITISKQAILTGASNTLVASGGRYRLQFGSQAATMLDPYAKLLSVQVAWDESTSSAVGSATSLALAPNGIDAFVVDNKTSVRTIPQTSTSGSTDCSLALQFGSGNGTSFVARTPQAGEACWVYVVFSNSTAP
jgi:hypothetical protein